MYEIIKHYEGLHDGDLSVIGLQPKMDPKGIWTEGWGHAITDAKGNFVKGAGNKALAYKLSIIKTVEDADRQLAIDAKSVDLLIARKITVTLSDQQREAVRSMFYNCGYSATLTAMINRADPGLFEWWCAHYITGDGKELPGLVARRKTEATYFKTGKLQFFN